MKRFSLRAISVALGVLFLASCNGSSSGGPNLGNLPGPPVQPTFSRMFDGQAFSSIFIIPPPFAAPLTPAGAFPKGGAQGFLAFNPPNGMLASSLITGSVKIYNPPYSNSTAPTATISGGASTLSAPEGVAWDASGNLWVADFNHGVDEFSPPFSATSAPAATNANISGNPTGLAINPSAGLMFVASVNPGHAVRVFPAPYTGVPTATLSPSASPWPLAVDQLGRLFVGDSGSGTISVYTPPFATGNAPAFTLSAGSGVLGLAFDSAQNLYAQFGNGSAVVFNGPILGPISAPSTVLGCPSGVCNMWGGIAFGP